MTCTTNSHYALQLKIYNVKIKTIYNITPMCTLVIDDVVILRKMVGNYQGDTHHHSGTRFQECLIPSTACDNSCIPACQITSQGIIDTTTLQHQSNIEITLCWYALLAGCPIILTDIRSFCYIPDILKIFFFCRSLQTKECRDEQFSFKPRGDVYVKGVTDPMKCYLLSRNLRKLPKVHMLLETDLTSFSRTPSPVCSPSEPTGMYHSIVYYENWKIYHHLNNGDLVYYYVLGYILFTFNSSLLSFITCTSIVVSLFYIMRKSAIHR